jgi:SNF2 family DNA or RNA helicase
MQVLVETFYACIYRDDMGMGKTIMVGTSESLPLFANKLLSQVACFLLAQLGKDGTGADAQWCRQRRKYGHALLDAGEDATDQESVTRGPQKQRLPVCLIACPASLQDNWKLELCRWGYFLVDVLKKSNYVASDDDNPLELAREGMSSPQVTSHVNDHPVQEKLKFW